MDHRTQAVAILKRARAMLIDRLAQRVSEAELEILEDAEGGSFHSEIESIFEQLGSRLSNVNALLSGLNSGEDSLALAAADADLLSLADFPANEAELSPELSEAPMVLVMPEPLEAPPAQTELAAPGEPPENS